jgi:hypothetical protein
VREDHAFALSSQLVYGDGTLAARLGQNHGGPFATSDCVLYATGDWSGFRVELLSRNGAPRFSCVANSQWALTGRAAFNGRQLAVLGECAVCENGVEHLQVFDVGNLGVASSGWVAPRGTPGGAGHAR